MDVEPSFAALFSSNVGSIHISSLAFDTCASNQLAVEEALILAADSEVYRNRTFGQLAKFLPSLSASTERLGQLSPPLLGVIGPMSTNSVTAVSPFFSTFDIPHVSYWASSTLFDDTTQYPFLFRTVPSDEDQARAIADLIEHFGWTYVSLVAATDDEYSGLGFELIRAEAAKRGTFCFAMQSRFGDQPQFRSHTEFVVDSLKSSSARVVILYAAVTSARVFFQVSMERNLTDKIFIGGHDWINRMEFPRRSFLSQQPIIGLAPRTVASSTTIQVVEDIRRVLRNATYIQGAVQVDPWLRAYVEKQQRCVVPASGCSVLTKRKQNVSRHCSSSDFVRFRPRDSFAVAEALILGTLATGLAALNLVRADILADAEINLPSGRSIKQALETVSMNCRNLSGRCDVFDAEHKTYPSYYIQNFQQTSLGQHDTVSIGQWTLGSGFQWNDSVALDLKNLGMFMAANSTDYDTANHGFPTSNCSTTCKPSQYRVFADGQASMCCWTCIPCSVATYSNATNANNCFKCELGHGSNGTACFAYVPIQKVLTDSTGLIVLAMAVVGFIVTISTLIYFHWHSMAPLVRASDLTLSTVSLVAMLVGHLLVPVILIPTSITSTYCTLSALLPEPIKTVVVSAVLVKTKRFNTVFKSMRIISRHQRRRLLLGNPVQLCAIALLTVINIVLVLLYAFIDPPQALQELLVDRTYIYCDLRVLWFALLSAYNVILLLVCIILAFLTRKLPEEYNDAQLLYLASLTGFVVWFGLFPTYIVSGRDLRPVISAIFLEGELLAFWVCLYCPRMVQMLRHKKYRLPKETSQPGITRIAAFEGGQCPNQLLDADHSKKSVTSDFESARLEFHVTDNLATETST